MENLRWGAAERSYSPRGRRRCATCTRAGGLRSRPSSALLLLLDLAAIGRLLSGLIFRQSIRRVELDGASGLKLVMEAEFDLIFSRLTAVAGRQHWLER